MNKGYDLLQGLDGRLQWRIPIDGCKNDGGESGQMEGNRTGPNGGGEDLHLASAV